LNNYQIELNKDLIKNIQNIYSNILLKNIEQLENEIIINKDL
jgi:hypothetical protein